MALAKLLQLFIQDMQNAGKSDLTIEKYKRILNEFIDITKLTEWTELDYIAISNYRQALNEKNLQINTIRDRYIIISRFLNFLYSKKLITEKLSDLIELPSKGDVTEKEVFTIEEIEQIKKYLDDKVEKEEIAYDSGYSTALRVFTEYRNKLFIHTLLYSGCRASEGVAIKYTDIDFKAETVTLKVKGGRSNTIAINPKLLAEIYVYMDKVKHLSNLAKVDLTSEYLFANTRKLGSNISRRTALNIQKDIAEDLGIEMTNHKFRHNLATHGILNGVPIPVISKQLSHRSKTITLDTYSHVIDNKETQKELLKIGF